ncbi:MAG: hypothetical protein JRM87_04985 [Nitrososphaerota archaeon]|nr:hypothetical protein [Nitrososphaerota archaeon]
MVRIRGRCSRQFVRIFPYHTSPYYKLRIRRGSIRSARSDVISPIRIHHRVIKAKIIG